MSVTPLRQKPAKADAIAFKATGRGRYPVVAARPMALTLNADRFEWARQVRRQSGISPAEKVLATVIAELINREAGNPRFGTAWAGRLLMASEAGLSQNAVDEALPALRRRGWILTRKMGMGGTLEIRLATPETLQSRPRGGECETGSDPAETDNLGHVAETFSGTCRKLISGTGPKYQYKDQRREQSMALDQGDNSGTCSALYPRAIVRHWSDEESLIPTPENDEHAQSLLAWAVRQALNRPSATYEEARHEFGRLPKHLRQLLADELQDGTLTLDLLAETLIRHGASQGTMRNSHATGAEA